MNQALTQSPHGAELKMDCIACHNTKGWDIPQDQWKFKEEQIKEYSSATGLETTKPDSSFNHFNTDFPLRGTHESVDCRSCHSSLIFNEASTQCIDCHLDVHSMTVGNDCARCHNPENWLVDDIPQIHEENGFPLIGSHGGLSCVDCHVSETSLRFDRIGNDCYSCHRMDFENTTSPNHVDGGFSINCIDCHSPDGGSWGTEIVDHSFFPLTLGHDIQDCNSCHTTDNFSDASPDCISCHQNDFSETTSPNHASLNFNNDCTQCHTTNPGWMPATFDIHDEYYVLEGAHALIANNCMECHTEDFSNTPNTCIGCHIDDYNGTSDPDHESANFSTDCTQCHTQDAWQPSNFDHDADFPIYSGEHDGKWNDCIDCHTNTTNYLEFQCTGCHVNPATDDEHLGISGYIYEDNACLACHPNGDANMAFDHNTTNFPLTGSHIGVECLECHSNGFEGTSTNCVDCHTMDFEGSTNPNHTAINIPTDCINCHTTESNWMPATFDIHDDYYTLEGAHTVISNDCASCHNGDYNNTPNTCVGCHLDDFNGTTNPDHEAANFSTDCTECHSQDVWEPSTFDHDSEYFPIFSGEHQGKWSDCIDCHTNPNNYQEFQCTGCHINPETDEQHNGIPGYIYEDNACFGCHPTGDADMAFDHNATNFPLTGSHIGVDCLDCHSNGFEGTSTNCVDCHTIDFEGSINPNHSAINIPTDCINCHTTEPDWMPATFDIHDDYYTLEGAHAMIANDCVTCHNGDYNNTPNTCIGCHSEDFNSTVDPDHEAANFSTDCTECHSQDVWNPSTFDHNSIYELEGAHADISQECLQCHSGGYENTPNTCIGCHQSDFDNTTDPNHMVAQFSTDCITCHNQDAWEPANFDHDGQYFPIYSGPHDGEWGECIDCHTNPDNYGIFSCIGCHMNPETDDDHNGVGGYIYEDNACLACHPTGEADEGINHDDTNFPLTGAHIMTDCIECHADGYQGTTTECNGCHNEDYLNSVNPNHNALGMSTDCINCHTTEPGWAPATFDIHDDYYELTGAHIPISADCAACHDGDYNNTPTECVDCHLPDFEGSLNPNHQNLNIPTDCAACHTTEPDWMPATFDIHDDYYPLEGAHATISNECATCHNGDYNNTPNTCIGCHQVDYDNTTNPDHGAAMFPDDCLECHTQDAWIPSTFDHDGMYFPIYTGSHDGEWSVCLDCHTDQNNFSLFTCISCHLNPETDDDHNGIGGYIYEDNACLACHPTGEAEEGINHDDTNFPLTGAHIMTDCIDCHANGYQGTPTDCNDCHNEDFNGSTNPNHNGLGISTDCISCHTTDPGWAPATFDIHNDYYELTGAHIPISADCAACHNGDYNNTPTDCVGCHQADFEASINPNHQALNISNDCVACHTTEPDWAPATFDVHDDYYPLTGAHLTIANECVTCHNGDYNNTPSECAGCHQADYDASVNPNHGSLNLSTDCMNCHTTDVDWMPATFDVHDDYYALNGAHAIIANDCAACHNGDYINTPNTCIGCHQSDYDNTPDPDHAAAMFSTECLECHTEDAWVPSTFDHNAIWPLNGAHANIANECLQCHANGYENTPNTCIGCHQSDYDNTTNPDHAAAMFPTDCTDCHNETAWIPSTFDHDNQYFPIYSGKHDGEWNLCVDCHMNANDYSIFSCIDCHEHDDQTQVDDDHDEVNGYVYESNACFACHPTGEN